MAKLAVAAALEMLKGAGEPYRRLIERRDFDVGIYRPDAIDEQTPHARDELYIVAVGTGTFVCEGQQEDFAPGDLFFVEAGRDHRFENFSNDFATWVVFFGGRSK